jgi:uncharacterized protein YhbP (UPF0306 family)
VIDGCAVDRVVAANRYLVLGTADGDGQPWVTPVFFALLDPDRVCWVSSPDSRHSRNIARRARVGITIFDSSVEVGRAEVVYFDVDAAQATADESDTALQSLSSRLPHDKRLSGDDLQPHAVGHLPGRSAASLRPRPRRQPRIRKRGRHDGRGLTAARPARTFRLDANAEPAFVERRPCHRAPVVALRARGAGRDQVWFPRSRRQTSWAATASSGQGGARASRSARPDRNP